MKKLQKSVVAATMAMLMLSACSNDAMENNIENLSDISAANLETHIENAGQSAESDSDKTASAEHPEQTENSKILIAYFSRWGNTNYPDDVDATTSASIVVDDSERYGTTEYAANIIKETVGGDLYRIETVTLYTADFDELRDINHSEMQQEFLPELKESDLDISQYDTVFIGYPVWATSVPQAVVSFMNKYDLSDKTVIPFCTHDGYGAGDSYNEVAEASGAAASLDGIAIEAKDVPDSREEIVEWLKKIGISPEREQAQTDIHITIGDTVLDGVLYDTAPAEEIKEYFPLTISMVGYGGREYYGGVDFYPQNLEGGQKNFENGDITYCEAHHNMAIFYAQTDDPNLSVDVIPIGRVTSDLSVFENLSGSEEITFSLAE